MGPYDWDRCNLSLLPNREIKMPQKTTPLQTRLRDIRKRLKIRQKIVAAALNMSISEVSRIERGLRRLRTDQLEKWAESLGHSTVVLIIDDDPMLNEKEIALLETIASALQYMPVTTKDAMGMAAELWKTRYMQDPKGMPHSSAHEISRALQG